MAAAASLRCEINVGTDTEQDVCHIINATSLNKRQIRFEDCTKWKASWMALCFHENGPALGACVCCVCELFMLSNTELLHSFISN